MRYRDLQHPVITAMERTGYPDGKEPKMPTCPCCGDPCHTFYSNQFGNVFACENCVSVDEAEYLMEEPDDA